MTAWTYILRCADGTYYAGSTIDLHNRVAAHKQGLGAAYTKRRLPVELVWSCDFERVEDAFALEKSIQGWSHAKREAFIDGGIAAIRRWSDAHPSRSDRRVTRGRRPTGDA
ncbi:GIY-YIG nuclease family protein [Microbacterium lacusdiani]